VSYTGQLNDGGEKLTLSHPTGGDIFSVTYQDVAPWPVTPDGYGYSLVPLSPGATQAPDDGQKWRASTFVGGSPGADDPLPSVAPIVVNEILTHTDLPVVDKIELFNPTGTNVNIGGWFLTDDPDVPKKFRITNGTIISARGFIMFDESQFNATPGTNNSFSLNSSGDQVYLFSGDAKHEPHRLLARLQLRRRGERRFVRALYQQRRRGTIPGTNYDFLQRDEFGTPRRPDCHQRDSLQSRSRW
jgi:hypothetical protein